jgi:hypothetical protein
MQNTACRGQFGGPGDGLRSSSARAGAQPAMAWTPVRLRVAEIDAIDFFELGILDDDAGTESLVDSDVNVTLNCA